jgi:hypothetical protein
MNTMVKAGSYVEIIGGLSSMNLGGKPTIRDQASYDRAMKEFRSAESERDRAELSLGRAFDADAKDGETFGKLSRYETAIERSLFRSLHELRQIQERRHNCSTSFADPVPAMDRTVNGAKANWLCSYAVTVTGVATSLGLVHGRAGCGLWRDECRRGFLIGFTMCWRFSASPQFVKNRPCIDPI